MMEFFSAASTVLALSFVIGYHSSLTGGDAAIEPSLNNTVNIVQRTEAFQKRDATKPQLCGRTKVVTSPLSRHKNSFKDYGDDLYDDDEHLDRIFGGSYTAYGETPWQAAIIFMDTYVCSGAIISEFWVISAAQCFRNRQSSSITISVGDHIMWQKDTYEARYAVNRIITHGERRGYENDIALIKINATRNGRGIQFNDYVQPICLPNPIEGPPVGIVVTATGWGRPGNDGWKSAILKKAKFVISRTEICETDFPYIYNTKTICIFNLDRDSELCSGDSGTPVAYIIEAYAVLVGVNSYNSRCEEPILSAGLTNVPLLRSWIDETIRLNSNGFEGVLPQRRYVGG